LAAVTFGKTGAALTNRSAFARSNGTAGSRSTRLLIEGLQPRLEQKSMSPMFDLFDVRFWG